VGKPLKRKEARDSAAKGKKRAINVKTGKEKEDGARGKESVVKIASRSAERSDREKQNKDVLQRNDVNFGKKKKQLP